MKSPERYTVTSALPYANGPLHIGHLAGAYLPADIYVRFLRSKGKEVLFICGSDEHGAAITLRAKKEGISPREIVDKYHALLDKSFSDLGISFDVYHRTSSEEHYAFASDFFLKLLDKKTLEEISSEQYYDEEFGVFLADRYITGTCPKCSSEKAYGDQCEKCGSTLSPLELISPVSTLSGKTPVLRTTVHWYLPLQSFENWLRKFILEGKDEDVQIHNPSEWKNHVLGQCKSWLDAGLHARAMTRDLDWGVPVPLPGMDGKVLYVWLDAPLGYITATKHWATNKGEDWEKWWKSDSSRLIHFIGKDNIVFHCLIFPALLKAHGSYIFPYNVPAMEFMNLEGEKISTSREWAVWVHEYVQEFPGKEDVLRYVLASLMPEQKDSEFTWADYRDRNNNELADILGNFVNRVVVLSEKYYSGKSPSTGELSDSYRVVLENIRLCGESCGKFIEGFRFRDALSEAMNLARIGNKFLTEEEPWKLSKTNPDKAEAVLYVCTQITAALGIFLEPFLPFTASKLRAIYGMAQIPWDDVSGSLIPGGTSIQNPGILFNKVDDAVVEFQRNKLTARKEKVANQVAAVADIKPSTNYEAFSKMDLRSGTIVHAEKIAKAKKLLQLTVDIGIEKRNVVSGIAEYYSPEEVIGKKVCLLSNLEPREIKGVLSEGMILMAESPDGKLIFVSPASDLPNGSGIR